MNWLWIAVMPLWIFLCAGAANAAVRFSIERDDEWWSFPFSLTAVLTSLPVGLFGLLTFASWAISQSTPWLG